MSKFLTALRTITPNRVVVYITALANITAALLPLVTDAGWEQLVAPIAGINAVAVMFLKGWQQYEKAIYQAEFITKQAAMEAEARAHATTPSPGRSIKVPR